MKNVKIDKDLFFCSLIIDLNRENEREGKELAQSIVYWHKNGVKGRNGIIETCIGNFLGNFYYRLGEINYLVDLAKRDKVKITSDSLKHIKGLVKSGNEKICDWYTGTDFIWDQLRFQTPKEKKAQNDNIMKIIKAMRKKKQL